MLDWSHVRSELTWGRGVASSLILFLFGLTYWKPTMQPRIGRNLNPRKHNNCTGVACLKLWRFLGHFFICHVLIHWYISKIYSHNWQNNVYPFVLMTLSPQFLWQPSKKKCVQVCATKVQWRRWVRHQKMWHVYFAPWVVPRVPRKSAAWPGSVEVIVVVVVVGLLECCAMLPLLPIPLGLHFYTFWAWWEAWNEGDLF